MMVRYKILRIYCNKSYFKFMNYVGIVVQSVTAALDGRGKRIMNLKPE